MLGKSVLLVSSGQPSLNPRLVKEADALSRAGYDVTVIYAYWNNWATRLDKELLPTKTWKAIRVGGAPDEHKLTYLLSRLIFKAARTLTNLFGLKLLADIAIARSAFFLTREAKKHQADFYIGHNLGALPAVIKAAEQNGKPCGFDAEDFHRNEVTNDKTSYSYKIAKHLEDKYLSQLNYLSTASPLISEQYSLLYPDINPFTILNTFPKINNLAPRTINNGPIRLFWFSQTIGPDRGLEIVFEALNIIDNDVFELHLLGDTSGNSSFVNGLTSTLKNVYIHPVLPSDEIVRFAAQFDIGLAADVSTPLNRDICLTNKLFTYLQAGLAIAATDTSAQRLLLSQNQEIGTIYQQNDVQSLVAILLKWETNRQLLLDNCEAALSAGQGRYSWETESEKFLALIKNKLAG